MTTTRLDLLELDIDCRLSDLWQTLWRDFDYLSRAASDQTRQEFAVFMRAAYGKGYMDALKDRGELCRDHGYTVPPQT